MLKKTMITSFSAALILSFHIAAPSHAGTVELDFGDGYVESGFAIF